MRAIAVYFGVIGLVIWMASDGQIDRLSTRLGMSALPGGNSAPLGIPLEVLPNAADLNSLDIIPAAHAGDLSAATVVVSVVNLRAGPGLSYRMLDVAARGEILHVSGQWVDGWAPVVTPDGNLNAWVHGNYIAASK